MRRRRCVVVVNVNVNVLVLVAVAVAAAAADMFYIFSLSRSVSCTSRTSIPAVFGFSESSSSCFIPVIGTRYTILEYRHHPGRTCNYHRLRYVRSASVDSTYLLSYTMVRT